MKIGLVYYSRTGNTRQVAKMLEKKLIEKKAEVDLIEIEHVKKPGFFAAGKAGTKQLELPMKNIDLNMGKYDVILAGSPIWNKRPSTFIITFIKKAQDMKGKKIAVFSNGLSPITERGPFKEILKTNLEIAGVKPFDSFLALQFKREKLVDGDQNIDNFVNSVLRM